MSGITAKLFAFFINLQTVIVFGGLAYFLYATDTLANPITGGSVAAWIVAFIFFILYIGFVGQFVVANHTRELTEQQVKLLEQIQFQLTRINSVQGTAQEGERKEPVL